MLYSCSKLFFDFQTPQLKVATELYGLYALQRTCNQNQDIYQHVHTLLVQYQSTFCRIFYVKTHKWTLKLWLVRNEWSGHLNNPFYHLSTTEEMYWKVLLRYKFLYSIKAAMSLYVWNMKKFRLDFRKLELSITIQLQNVDYLDESKW